MCLPRCAARLQVPQITVEPTPFDSAPGNHGGSLLLAQDERRRAAQGGLRGEHPAHACEAPAAAAGAGRPHSLAGPSCGPPRSGPLRPGRSHHGILGPPGHVRLRVVRDSVVSELPSEQRTQASGRPWQERAALCACPRGCAMQLYPGEGPVCDYCFVDTDPQPNCDCAEDCPCHRFWHDSEEDPEPALFGMWGCSACPNGSIHDIRGRTATRTLWGESKALQSRARRRGGL